MSEPYSLAKRAWLPVVLEGGRRVFVRPCDITDPDLKILRLATGRPDCDVSLTELLIGLLAVACPPTSGRDWHRRFLNPPSADELQAAFEPLGKALVLDGDGPRFFQDFETLEGEANGIAGLFIDAPGDNTVKENADHFVKRGRITVLSRAGGVIALATLQTSAPSGGAGHRTSLRGGGPLTTLVFPGAANGAEPSLWQKLWANVPNHEDGDELSAENAPRIFPWLGKTRVSDKGGKTTTPADVHPAQAFFGMPRRIRLNFEANRHNKPCDLLGIVDDVIVTSYVTRPWGVNYTAWSRAHPLSPYYKPKETDAEYLPLHLQSSRIGYRQWLGMVMETPKGMRVPAECLNIFRQRAVNFRENHPEVIHGARLLVAGYAMDNMKPLDFAEALLPQIVTGDPSSDEQLRHIVGAWINGADEVANQLVSAIKRALYGENGKAERNSTVLDAVKSRFWADSESDFYDALQAVTKLVVAKRQPDELHALKQAVGADWLNSLKRHAFAIFDDTAPVEDADGDRIEDVIAGRKMLGMMLSGYGKGGAKLFDELNQPKPETRKGRGEQ